MRISDTKQKPNLKTRKLAYKKYPKPRWKYPENQLPILNFQNTQKKTNKHRKIASKPQKISF